jgi:hypothetical protein
MKITQLIEQLGAVRDAAGDVDVLYKNGEGPELWEVFNVALKTVAESDNYPEDWNMPPGLQFVQISN